MELKGQNGAEIVINSAPLKDALRLKNSVVKELAKTGIELNGLDLNNLSKDMQVTDSMLNAFVKPVLTIDSSPEFYDAAMKCMIRCTYNKEKITEDTFESEESREDYYTILIEVVKINLRPFFKGAASGFAQFFQFLGKEESPK